MKKLTVMLFLLGMFCLTFAQTELTFLQQKFRTFDYDGVIELANELLTRSDQFTKEQLVRIYEMKAVSHYSKSEMEAARYAFLSLLKIDPTFEPDPINTSPKIITFFNSVESDFDNQSEPPDEPMEQIVRIDTVTIIEQELGIYQKSIPASIIFPGAGHFIMGEKKRGVILAALNIVALSSAIYYTNQTQKKRDLYSSAVDEAVIASTYDAYNSAYKKRNILWGAFAAVWIYSQTDLIFFHPKRTQLNISAIPSFHPHDPSRLVLSLHF